MKTTFLSLFLLSVISLLSNKIDDDELELIFIDSCSGKLVDVEYEKVFFKGTDEIFIYYDIKRNNMNSLRIQEEIPVEKTIDTIYIPKVLYLFGNEIHNAEQFYMNCNFICDGKEIEYFNDGKTRLIGEFDNGIPKKISHFWKNGKIRKKEYYEKKSFFKNRIEYYSKTGRLEDYNIIIRSDNKTTTKSYNNDNRLTEEFIEYHQN
jgi:hypothetical protein